MRTLRTLVVAVGLALAAVVDAQAQTGAAGPAPARVLADVHGPDGPGAWDYAAVDVPHHRLLVARMTGVETLGLGGTHTTGQLVAGRHVHAVLPLPDGRVLFTNGDSDSATVVDGADGRLVGGVTTGAKPDGAIYDPSSGQVLVMDGDDGTVTRIALSPVPHAVDRIAVGGGLEAPALDGRGHLFVNIEDKNALAVVDLGSGKAVRTIPIAGCEGPTGLAYKAKEDMLVSACGNGVVAVLRTDGTEVARLKIGPHPDAVIDDPAHERVFIPSGGDATLAEIDLSGMPRVVRRLATRPGARTGAYDPATERLYLPYGNTIHTKGQPPRLVPGSFGVLILDAR